MIWAQFGITRPGNPAATRQVSISRALGMSLFYLEQTATEPRQVPALVWVLNYSLTQVRKLLGRVWCWYGIICLWHILVSMLRQEMISSPSGQVFYTNAVSKNTATKSCVSISGGNSWGRWNYSRAELVLSPFCHRFSIYIPYIGDGVSCAYLLGKQPFHATQWWYWMVARQTAMKKKKTPKRKKCCIWA